MVREDIVESMVDYFKSDQWQDFMKMLTQTDDPVYHIHIYAENSVHPESLAKLFTEYHRLKQNVRLVVQIALMPVMKRTV